MSCSTSIINMWVVVVIVAIGVAVIFISFSPQGAFILDADFGQMDWATEEVMMIELTLKYDYAILQY